MLCTWEWLGHYRSHVMGTYQSDTDDLKAFMKRYSRQVALLHCTLQDGRQYLWKNPLSKNDLCFERGGWFAL